MKLDSIEVEINWMKQKLHKSQSNVGAMMMCIEASNNHQKIAIEALKAQIKKKAS